MLFRSQLWIDKDSLILLARLRVLACSLARACLLACACLLERFESFVLVKPSVY